MLKIHEKHGLQPMFKRVTIRLFTPNFIFPELTRRILQRVIICDSTFASQPLTASHRLLPNPTNRAFRPFTNRRY
jgi:hypothetical protein